VILLPLPNAMTQLNHSKKSRRKGRETKPHRKFIQQKAKGRKNLKMSLRRSLKKARNVAQKLSTANEAT
jgi:hypothetical protein